MGLTQWTPGCPCCGCGCGCTIDVNNVAVVNIDFRGHAINTAGASIRIECACGTQSSRHQLGWPGAYVREYPPTSVPWGSWYWRNGFTPPRSIPPNGVTNLCDYGYTRLTPYTYQYGGSVSVADLYCGQTTIVVLTSLTTTATVRGPDAHYFWLMCADNEIYLHHWFGKWYKSYSSKPPDSYKYFYTIRRGTLVSCKPLLIEFPASPDGWASQSRQLTDGPGPPLYTDFSGAWVDGTGLETNPVSCASTAQDARNWPSPFGEIAISVTNA